MKTKPCPYCAEEIKVTARRCRFCKEAIGARGRILALDPRWEGSKLIVPSRAHLRPTTCWICGKHKGVKPFPKTFSYVPGWSRIHIFLALAMQQKAELHLPLCARCRNRWRYSQVALVGACVFGFFEAFFCAMIGASVTKGDDGVAFGFFAGLVLAASSVLAVKLLLVNKHQIRSERIENGEVTLLLPRPDAVREALEDEKAAEDEDEEEDEDS